MNVKAEQMKILRLFLFMASSGTCLESINSAKRLFVCKLRQEPKPEMRQQWCRSHLLKGVLKKNLCPMYNVE